MTDLGLLTLIQWLSPAFPTGGYAYSHGMEQAMAVGDVRDAGTAGAWIADILEQGAGRTDAILLARGLDAGADLDGLSDLARALASSAERLRETMDQGTAFALATAALTGVDLPARPLPLAVAQAAATLDLKAERVVAVYLHAFAANLISAAVRFLPLGQTEGQATLSGLHKIILRLADQAAIAPLSDIGTGAIRADLAAMQHEVLDIRIFRT